MADPAEGLPCRTRALDLCSSIAGTFRPSPAEPLPRCTSHPLRIRGTRRPTSSTSSRPYYGAQLHYWRSTAASAAPN
eukprot:6173411-Amphidinium_carterae.1